MVIELTRDEFNGYVAGGACYLGQDYDEGLVIAKYVVAKGVIILEMWWTEEPPVQEFLLVSTLTREEVMGTVNISLKGRAKLDKLE